MKRNKQEEEKESDSTYNCLIKDSIFILKQKQRCTKLK